MIAPIILVAILFVGTAMVGAMLNDDAWIGYYAAGIMFSVLAIYFSLEGAV